MRISTFFGIVCFLIASGARLAGQAAAEYGAATAASTTGTASGAKGVSKSIGGVFGSLGKKLDAASAGKSGDPTPKAAPVKPATSTIVQMPAAGSVAKPEAPRIVRPSQIRIGMSREELLAAVGRPSMKTSGADEGVFRETYMYQGEVDTVTVTLRGGKVTGVSPSPEEESVTAPAFAAPTQTQSKAERPQ